MKRKHLIHLIRTNESGQIQMFSSNEWSIEAAVLLSEDYRIHNDETAR